MKVFQYKNLSIGIGARVLTMQTFEMGSKMYVTSVSWCTDFLPNDHVSEVFKLLLLASKRL